MVQINVSQLLKAPIGAIRQYDIDEAIEADGATCQVKGDLQLIRTDRGILARGNLTTQVELTCSRCLKRFTCPVALNIEEEYFPTIDVTTGLPVPPPEEVDSFTIDSNHILDLTEAIRQYLLLAIPMKPLCREDCAGLCPSCGANLNEAPCGCPPPPADSRWSKLLEAVAEKDTSINKQKETE
ncbi:MAG: DUF177 domain-containing protein [Chloroflexota bacterium]